MVRRLIGMAALVLVSACAPPESSAPESTAQLALGAPDSVLFWRDDVQRDGYRNMDRVFPTRTIRAGGTAYPLPENPVDLSTLSFDFGDTTFDLDSFVEHNSIVGLLVLKDGEVALERYEHGNEADTKWVSYSISKSVVAMLVGAAIQDGYIEDLDASVADYLPSLRGSSYEDVTLRHTLQMASGVSWNDGYADYDSDINTSLRIGTVALLEELGSRERVAEPGQRFNYNTGETHLLATALRAAIGNNLSDYLSTEIWGPFGMEADGNWMLVEENGGEHGGCCFSATLRDYGRLGLFAMGDGVLPNGERVLPEGWMTESTTPSPANPGYGYLWWLQPGGAYAAIGIFGQMIWIDPAEQVVVVTQSAWPNAISNFGQGYAFAAAVREALRD